MGYKAKPPPSKFSIDENKTDTTGPPKKEGLFTRARKSLAATSSSQSLTSSVSTTSTKSVRPAGNSPAKSRRGKGRESIAELNGDFVNPGQKIEPMTAGDFKAISQDEALATFYAS